MVGNSLKSDILPVCKIGGLGIYIPYHTTWEWEIPEENHSINNYIEVESIADIQKLFCSKTENILVK